MQPTRIRSAERADLDALCDLERLCFSSDRLSRRSFSHLIKAQHDSLLVVTHDGTIAGYGLVLYRSGTNLARLYSIAIHPTFQGMGIAQQLLATCERQARDRGCAFMRLEVSQTNASALRLYTQAGYHQFGQIKHYYEDGSDAWRMEKTIRSTARHPTPRTQYYEQTTPFTCGPASLLMAMSRLKPERKMTRREELRIWREATTIYMTSGHGGCSPHGLALSARNRGFDVSLYINTNGTPFIDSVRDPAKKTVIEEVHRDYLQQINASDVELVEKELEIQSLVDALQQGAVAVALISTWRLNRNKAPHWVLLAGADERYIYISDPDSDREPWLSETDYIDVPVAYDEFKALAQFGRSRLRTVLILKPD